MAAKRLTTQEQMRLENDIRARTMKPFYVEWFYQDGENRVKFKLRNRYSNDIDYEIIMESLKMIGVNTYDGYGVGMGTKKEGSVNYAYVDVKKWKQER
ncbi:MAG: hypothetical protein MPK62_00815 [Alphaproteobacteria bacterium]|nr:hypothetical protein [Alphaproteobacteria bacterium]MDA8029680.1 hypothetical protein [Alphaproteobacteria bacterium]